MWCVFVVVISHVVVVLYVKDVECVGVVAIAVMVCCQEVDPHIVLHQVQHLPFTYSQLSAAADEPCHWSATVTKCHHMRRLFVGQESSYYTLVYIL